MTARTRPLYDKEGQPAIMVLVTEEEIDGCLDAFDVMLEDGDPSPDDKSFYEGLKRRWMRHGKEIRKSMRENGMEVSA